MRLNTQKHAYFDYQFQGNFSINRMGASFILNPAASTLDSCTLKMVLFKRTTFGGQPQQTLSTNTQAKVFLLPRLFFCQITAFMLRIIIIPPRQRKHNRSNINVVYRFIMSLNLFTKNICPLPVIRQM